MKNALGAVYKAKTLWVGEGHLIAEELCENIEVNRGNVRAYSAGCFALSTAIMSFVMSTPTGADWRSSMAMVIEVCVPFQ
jgi:hypothetical protein